MEIHSKIVTSTYKFCSSGKFHNGNSDCFRHMYEGLS